MMWVLRALLGASAVLLIQLLSQTKSYFVAGLVPLFPTFALIAHYIVGSQRSVADLRQTILFGMAGLIPYFLYLLSLYFLLNSWKLSYALLGATGVWLVSAAGLYYIWR
ncbi:GlpM family protein [Candidatus Bipolaricaulota bacterium]